MIGLRDDRSGVRTVLFLIRWLATNEKALANQG